MDSLDERYYRGSDFKCVFERKPQGNCVKVYHKAHFLADVNKFPTPRSEDKYVPIEEYEAPPYENEQEAYAHACGWIDYIFFYQTDSDKNKALWEKAYSICKEIYEDKYKVALSFDAERAYKAGWEKGLKVKNIDRDVDG
ncbi:hypothetical protein [Microcoleus sp. AT9b-C3]|uniref:hypothetical protein n=1 Tax=unclassified Microcoleus TaxID=2642155 RepID=UPI002FCEA239